MSKMVCQVPSDADLSTLWREVRVGIWRIVRRSYRAARRAVAPARVGKIVLGTTLLVITAALLYIPAAVGYLFLYYKYLPYHVTTVPVHLQYGFGPNPFGIASLGPPSRIHNRQPYDITVSLALPRSPPNLNLGNFMLALHFLARDPSVDAPHALPYITPSPRHPGSPLSPITGEQPDEGLQPTRLNVGAFLAAHRILHTIARPALIPYADPFVASSSRLLFLPYHILFPRSAAAVRLAVPMAERLSFSSAASWRSGGGDGVGSRPGTVVHTTTTASGGGGGGGLLPGSVLLEVQAGQEVQVYDVSVTFTARLGGLRWFMCRWRGTAFVLFTGGFWVAEMAVMLLVVGGTRWVRVLEAGLGMIGGGGGGAAEEDLDRGWGDGDDDGEDDCGTGGGGGSKEETEKWTDEEESFASAAEDKGKGVKREPSSLEKGKGVKRGPSSPETGQGVNDEGAASRAAMWRLPEFGAEADGEDDSGQSKGQETDFGEGTSFSGEVSREGARRRNISLQESR